MRAIAGLSLLLLAGCDKATEPGFAETPEASQHTVAYLKSLCDGRASVAVTQDVTIRGFITANDLFGEFDRTIVVEDASGGISIAADHPSLADDYPFGAIATVRCNGLTLCNYGGKIELGAEPGDYGAGAIPREELSRHIRVTLPEEGESHRPPRSPSGRFRHATSTPGSGSTACGSPMRESPGATPTPKRGAPSPPSGRSSTPQAMNSPCGAPRRAHTQWSPCLPARAPVRNHRLFRGKIHAPRHQPRDRLFQDRNAVRGTS